MIHALPSLSAVGMVKQGLGHMEKLSAESVRGTKANKQDRPQERATVLHCTQSVGLTRFICGIIVRIALHATFPRYGMVLCPAMA